MHSQNQKTNRKSFGNLGVHKIEENHALPEPKKSDKKVFLKNWFWECIKIKGKMHSQLGVYRSAKECKEVQRSA